MNVRRTRSTAAALTAAAMLLLATACDGQGKSERQPANGPPTTQSATTQSASTNAPSPSRTTTSSSPSGSTAPSSMQYLSELDPLTSTQGVDTSAATVNGTGFARSVTQTANAGGPVNDAEYNIERRWQKFKATIGLRDDSPSGGRLTFEVSADGKSLYKQSVSLGQTQDVNVDLHSALRIKLTVTYSGQDNTYFYGTWGDARLEP